MLLPSEEGADGYLLIAHLLWLHFTIPVPFPVIEASEKPDNQGERQLMLDRQSSHAVLTFEKLLTGATSLIDPF